MGLPVTSSREECLNRLLTHLGLSEENVVPAGTSEQAAAVESVSATDQAIQGLTHIMREMSVQLQILTRQQALFMRSTEDRGSPTNLDANDPGLSGQTSQPLRQNPASLPPSLPSLLTEELATSEACQH